MFRLTCMYRHSLSTSSIMEVVRTGAHAKGDNISCFFSWELASREEMDRVQDLVELLLPAARRCIWGEEQI